MKHCLGWKILAVIIVCGWCVPAVSDKVYHVDGTVVTGKIKSETPDEITIETKYGPLSYDKTRLLKVERDEDAAKAAAAASAAAQSRARATPVNLSHMIPSGPINPFSPPVIPPLARLAAQTTGSATTTATAAK